jgi:carboxylate-amine ligase
MNEFTLGVEEEFMVIDPVTRELQSHEQKIVDSAQKIHEDQVKAEMHQAVVEVGTHICRNTEEARKEVGKLRTTVAQLGRRYWPAHWRGRYAPLLALAAPVDYRPPKVF